MVTLEKLGSLYKGVINNQKLTISFLNEIGFSSNDLEELLRKGIIIQELGIYNFIDANHLYCYGKELLSKRRVPEAITVFRKCYEIDPNHVKICFQLFYSSVKKGQYDESFKYFETFFSDENYVNKTDSNLYLYLLNLIIDLPEKYKKYLLTLNFEDFKIKIDDIRIKNLETENAIRKNIFENKFDDALKELTAPDNFNELLPLQRTIVVNLLRRIIKNKEESAKDVVSEKDSNGDETERKIYWFRQFMFEQRKYLEKRGISFLPEEEGERVMLLTDYMLLNYPQIEMIFITDGYNCQVVLRQFDSSKNMATVEDLMTLADQEFSLENFPEAKKIYLKLLRFVTVDPIVYERLGIIYSKNSSNEKTPIAFKFLELAKHFYTKNGLLEKEHELSNLIMELKGYLEPEIIDEEYDFNRENDCPAVNIQNITDYMFATGLGLNAACEEFKFSDEEIGLVMLAYAKEYYSQGDFSYGDSLMKSFEHWPNKNSYTKSLFKEIMKNKNFYASGRNPETPRLTLVVRFKQSKETK